MCSSLKQGQAHCTCSRTPHSGTYSRLKKGQHPWLQPWLLSVITPSPRCTLLAPPPQVQVMREGEGFHTLNDNPPALHMVLYHKPTFCYKYNDANLRFLTCAHPVRCLFPACACARHRVLVYTCSSQLQLLHSQAALRRAATTVQMTTNKACNKFQTLVPSRLSHYY